MSGEQVFALDIPSKSSPAFRRRAVSGSYRTPQSSTRPPRPVLTDRTILVPRPTQGISVLDLRDLRQTHLIPYDAKNVDNYPGNLAVADGIVVSLGNPNISWFFDTEAMVESARRALLENPKDSLAKDRLADCLRLRGMNQIEAKDYGAALESLREAEELFASLGPREAIVAKLALAMAEAHAARGEAKEAIAQLRRAFDLARDPDTRLRAGINLERELPRSAAADRAKLLEAIDKEFGRVRIGSEIGEIPVGLYLCIRRAETALPAVDGAADGHPNDPAAAVAAWQEILVRFPDELLGPGNPTLASAYARTRIADAIRRFGRGCYAAAEQSAARQLALLGADPSPTIWARSSRPIPTARRR
mgnify:CR=1 FL=1